jgi:hypothetical protein
MLCSQGITRLAEELSALKELLWPAELFIYFPQSTCGVRCPEFRNCRKYRDLARESEAVTREISFIDADGFELI